MDTQSQLIEWVYKVAPSTPHLGELSASLMEMFGSLDLGISRVNLGVFLLHPELAGLAYQQLSSERFPTVVFVSNQDMQSDVYKKSPIHHVIKERSPFCWRLSSPSHPFSFLDELKVKGYTEYLSIPMFGTHGRVHILSLATKLEGGFKTGFFEAICNFSRPFSLLVDSLTTHHLSEVLLQLYVGRKSGTHVLQGNVKLGQGQTIHAAMLYSDMRGFTKLCNEIGTTSTIDILNNYLSLVSEPIQAEGGEILKFMGDAVLAIFPVETDSSTSLTFRKLLETSAADACLRAARASYSNIKSWSAGNSGNVLDAGFGLSLGEVFYGNIGAPGRLDFTVIGNAVNLASRLESMCKEFDEALLVGPQFQQACHTPLRYIGKKGIKGYPHLISVYGDHGLA